MILLVLNEHNANIAHPSFSGHHLLLDTSKEVIVLHSQCHHTLCGHHIPVSSGILPALRFGRKGNFQKKKKIF